MAVVEGAMEAEVAVAMEAEVAVLVAAAAAAAGKLALHQDWATSFIR